MDIKVNINHTAVNINNFKIAQCIIALLLFFNNFTILENVVKKNYKTFRISLRKFYEYGVSRASLYS